MAALSIPTADSTVIKASSVNFTGDGACLVNGGSTVLTSRSINVNKLSVSVINPTGIPN